MADDNEIWIRTSVCMQGGWLKNEEEDENEEEEKWMNEEYQFKILNVLCLYRGKEEWYRQTYPSQSVS